MINIIVTCLREKSHFNLRYCYSNATRTEVEELQNELARLKRELYERTVERDLLKKLNELERGNAFRKHD